MLDVKSDPRRVVWMNVKGNPPMTKQQVEEDVRKGMDSGSVLMLNEYKWQMYWRTASRTALGQWGSSPGFAAGTLHPNRGAQPIMWKREVWRHEETRLRLMHDGVAGISEDRYMRAVLLRERGTQLRCWFATSHFVVGGDQAGDGKQRKAMLRQDITRMTRMLTALRSTGHPIIFQGDLNIHDHGWAYTLLRLMLAGLDARIVGEHGVEYTFIINWPREGRTRVEVERSWTIRNARLNTDHEARGLTFRLLGERTARTGAVV